MDVKQSLTQKARGVGDVIVRVQHDDYTGRPEVILASIPDPKAVRDLLNNQSHTARLEHQRRQQTHFYHQDLSHPIVQRQGEQPTAPQPQAGRSE